jgi:hypothetical protein
MQDLFLVKTDAATLIEHLGDDQNTLTIDDVRYDVVVIASSEGRTVALSATLATNCEAEFVLSAC